MSFPSLCPGERIFPQIAEILKDKRKVGAENWAKAAPGVWLDPMPHQERSQGPGTPAGGPRNQILGLWLPWPQQTAAPMPAQQASSWIGYPVPISFWLWSRWCLCLGWGPLRDPAVKKCIQRSATWDTWGRNRGTASEVLMYSQLEASRSVRVDKAGDIAFSSCTVLHQG